jgi:lysophospholipase L1-like esterase
LGIAASPTCGGRQGIEKMIVCHGDSLTQGDAVGAGHARPALLGNRLKVEVVNTAIGGDTTGGLLGRFYPDVANRRPRIVLLMGGTNFFICFSTQAAR